MNNEVEDLRVRIGEAHEVTEEQNAQYVYEPKFENLKDKSPEEKRRILKMIDEGGPVFLKKVRNRKK